MSFSEQVLTQPELLKTNKELTNKIIELEQQNKELRELMAEIADYLNRNKLNYIGSGSIFNQQINDILNKYK